MTSRGGGSEPPPMPTIAVTPGDRTAPATEAFARCSAYGSPLGGACFQTLTAGYHREHRLRGRPTTGGVPSGPSGRPSPSWLDHVASSRHGRTSRRLGMLRAHSQRPRASSLTDGFVGGSTGRPVENAIKLVFTVTLSPDLVGALVRLRRIHGGTGQQPAQDYAAATGLRSLRANQAQPAVTGPISDGGSTEAEPPSASISPTATNGGRSGAAPGRPADVRNDDPLPCALGERRTVSRGNAAQWTARVTVGARRRRARSRLRTVDFTTATWTAAAPADYAATMVRSLSFSAVRLRTGHRHGERRPPRRDRRDLHAQPLGTRERDDLRRSFTGTITDDDPLARDLRRRRERPRGQLSDW